MKTRAGLFSPASSALGVGRRSGGAGFTLLEVLLSLALVALLLVALNTFVFSMGELWGQGSEVRLFERHTRAVTRFLDQELRSAAWPPSGQVGQAAISLKEIRPESGITEPMLTFELREGSRLCTWPERPLPEVECSLAVRSDQGLILLWHSRLEKRFSEDPPRETVITPLVTAMAYEYYDADFKRWRQETTFQRSPTGEWLAPQRLRLTFTYRHLTREGVITLPSTPEGLPLL